ncbi:MAG: hypothetical protein JZU52_06855, partial [Lamprocystis purpurea]|nr:hypothetical protein [Lamprocystis purpurea]
LNRAQRGMRCSWMGSAPADSTIAGSGAVYSLKKVSIFNRVSTEVGEISKAEHTMKTTHSALDAV